jgi:hypothetical protein
VGSLAILLWSSNQEFANEPHFLQALLSSHG